MKSFRSAILATVVFGVCAMPALAKKVYIIDSYHAGYEWSDGLVNSAEKALKASGIEYKTFRMDTKNNPGEDFKKAAALKVKADIEAYKPDAIIAADDNASKYVIVPFFKGGTIPVFFCGVNWEATAYGFPCSNVTGMLEVVPFSAILSNIKNYAKGTRIGFIGVDNETSRKEALNTEKNFNVTMEKKYSKTFTEWKTAYTALQSTTDWILVENYAGITDWDSAAAETFVLANTKVPTATIYDWMAPFALITVAKSAEEQGEWAAAAAVKVLNGTAISTIPVDKNKRGVLILNQKLADKLAVKFDLNLIKQAKKILK